MSFSLLRKNDQLLAFFRINVNFNFSLKLIFFTLCQLVFPLCQGISQKNYLALSIVKSNPDIGFAQPPNNPGLTFIWKLMQWVALLFVIKVFNGLTGSSNFNEFIKSSQHGPCISLIAARHVADLV